MIEWKAIKILWAGSHIIFLIGARREWSHCPSTCDWVASFERCVSSACGIVGKCDFFLMAITLMSQQQRAVVEWLRRTLWVICVKSSDLKYGCYYFIRHSFIKITWQAQHVIKAVLANTTVVNVRILMQSFMDLNVSAPANCQLYFDESKSAEMF